MVCNIALDFKNFKQMLYNDIFITSFIKFIIVLHMF